MHLRAAYLILFLLYWNNCHDLSANPCNPDISSLLVFLCIADYHHHPCTCRYKKPSPDSKEETSIKMPDCNIFDNATKLVPYIF